MNAPVFPRRRDWWTLAAGLFILLVFCLGSRGLNEPDEGRYAVMGQAMARPGGDWWEPRLSGYAHYDKPPLLYWAVALGLRAFGHNEWAARVPSLLGAILALTGLGWTAWRLRGERVAWWSVLISGTSVQFWVLARVLSPDMLLTGWCALAVGAWAEGRQRGGAWRWWCVSLGFWTLGWWTKATPALIPLAGLAAGVWITGDRAGRRALRVWLLLPAIIVLGSPWYLSMLHRHPELRGFFFGRELAGRMTGKVDGRHGAIFYYIPVSLVAWLPWWPLAAWAAYRERALIAWREWSRRIGIEGWIVIVGLVIFSLAGSKLPTYSLTLAPWAALLVARFVARMEMGFPQVLLPLTGFATVSGLVLLAPVYEARLGVNASVRPVCNFLRAQEATDVYVDHYWAGMEFYLPEKAVHYVIHLDTPGDNDPLPSGVYGPPVKKHLGRDEHHHERASDHGQQPLRFVDPVIFLSQPPSSDHWLVRFRRNADSPFMVIVPTRLRLDDPDAFEQIGDFDIHHLPAQPPRP